MNTQTQLKLLQNLIVQSCGDKGKEVIHSVCGENSQEENDISVRHVGTCYVDDLDEEYSSDDVVLVGVALNDQNFDQAANDLWDALGEEANIPETVSDDELWDACCSAVEGVNFSTDNLDEDDEDTFAWFIVEV